VIPNMYLESVDWSPDSKSSPVFKKKRDKQTITNFNFKLKKMIKFKPR